MKKDPLAHLQAQKKLKKSVGPRPFWPRACWSHFGPFRVLTTPVCTESKFFLPKFTSNQPSIKGNYHRFDLKNPQGISSHIQFWAENHLFWLFVRNDSPRDRVSPKILAHRLNRIPTSYSFGQVFKFKIFRQLQIGPYTTLFEFLEIWTLKRLSNQLLLSLWVVGRRYTWGSPSVLRRIHTF